MFTFADGSVYEGEYVGNVRSGKGKMTYADGAVYEGSWEGGKRAGSGVYTYSNGDVYRGEWADDVKQGEGVYSSKATLSSYQGTFEGGAFARGEWLQSDGSRYTGAFAGGKP